MSKFCKRMAGLFALCMGIWMLSLLWPSLTFAWEESPTVALTATMDSSVYGQAVTFTVTVSGTQGAAQGMVNFFDSTNGTSTQMSGQYLDENGVATYTTSRLSTGSHAIGAIYEGDSNQIYQSAFANAIDVTVNQASTTTSITSDSNSPEYLQQVTLIATASAQTPGSGYPTGTMEFYDGKTLLGTGNVSGGRAHLSIPSSQLNQYLNAGSYSMHAIYDGDGNFTGSTSDVYPLTVDKATATTSITSDSDSSVYGQAVTLKATVSPPNPWNEKPTGTVEFYDGETLLGTGTLSGGAASLTTSALNAGSRSVTAVYVGDDNFKTSTSDVRTQAVDPATTTTSVASEPNPSVPGQDVTLTATVSAAAPSSGTPTGTVEFFDGTTSLGTGTLDVGGEATVTVPSLSLGTHNVTAVYAGDDNFKTSTSDADTQTVNQAATTSVTSEPNPSVYGQAVTLTATVSATAPSSGTPTGTVEFFDGTTSLGTGTLSVGGEATVTTSSLSLGTHSVTAVYGGDDDFKTSTSDVYTQTVNQVTTTTSMTSEPNPSEYGQLVTLTATVDAVAPGTGTPTGAVKFYADDGATLLGEGNLNGGEATFKTTGLSVGTYQVKAVYGGDSQFASSTSDVYALTIAASTNTGLRQTRSSTEVGQVVTLTATVTVSPLDSVTGTPTGTVEFFDETTSLGLPETLSDGVATLTTSALSVGTHHVKAVYSGGGNFYTSTSNVVTLAVTAAPAPTTTALTFTPSLPEFGQAVTFTATVRPVDSGADKPTGWVDFFDGTTFRGRVNLGDDGVATFTTTSMLSAGTHDMTAVYRGDANFNTSTSDVDTLTITAGTLGLTVTASDATGAGTDGQTDISVAETVGTGDKFVYQNVGGNTVIVPNIGDYLVGYRILPSDGIIPAANGDKIAVAEIDANGLVVKFGETTAVVEAEPVEITSFDAISNVNAGTVGSAAYADAAAVIAALPKSATANSSAVTVPVTTWDDTDGYDPNAAGSYTFTATLGTIPAGFANSGNYTATVEVVVSAESTTYTLTYTAGANGTITGHATQNVNSGEDGTAVTAVPDTGYHFVEWSDGNTNATRTDTDVLADLNVTATFAADGTGVTDVTGVTLDQPTLSLTAGGATATLTATVTPSDATNPNVTWSSSDTSVATVADGVVTPVAAGTATITVTTVDGGYTAASEVTVTAAPVITSPPPSQPTESEDSGADVLVNGKSESVGKATTTTENGQKVTTVTVDPDKLEQMLDAEGDNAVVTIPVSTDSDAVIGELDGQTVKNMEQKQAAVEIKTDNASYTLPAQQIDIDAIASQLGESVGLADIKIQIQIATPKTDTVKVVEDAASKGHFSLVVPPLNFTVTGTYGDKTVEVSKFNAYVKRTIAIPDGVNPSKVTTAVVVDPDGTVRQVPTKVVAIDGKYFAEINSLTNSTYSVVWHPIEFKDVANHWAKDAVNDMGSRMVVEGMDDGLFHPDQSITRAEFASIVVRALGLKLENGSSAFADVSDSAWYSGAVQTAHDYKLIDGDEDGLFHPQDKITREQAMAILDKAMALTGLKDKLAGQRADALLNPFVDAAKVSGWAKESVADNLAAGVVTGRDSGKLDPQGFMTRAEVAVMIERLLQKSGLI